MNDKTAKSLIIALAVVVVVGIIAASRMPKTEAPAEAEVAAAKEEPASAEANANAEAPKTAVVAELYYLTTCPYCHKAITFIDETLSKEFPEVTFRKIDVGSMGKDAKDAYQAFAKKNNLNAVPVFKVGEEFLMGFGGADSTGAEYRKLLTNALAGRPNDAEGAP